MRIAILRYPRVSRVPTIVMVNAKIDPGCTKYACPKLRKSEKTRAEASPDRLKGTQLQRVRNKVPVLRCLTHLTCEVSRTRSDDTTDAATPL